MNNLEHIITKYHTDKMGNPQSVHIIKKHQVSPIHNQIVLDELSDDFKGVNIITPENMYQVYNADEIVPDSFYIQNNSVIFFDKEMAGKEVVLEYYGIGIELLGANRVYTVLDANGNIIETLDDILKAGKIVIDAVKTMGDVIVIINQLNTTVNEAKILEPKLAEDIRVGTPLDKELKDDIGVGTPLLAELKPVVEKGTELNGELPEKVETANKTNDELRKIDGIAKKTTETLNAAIEEASELKDIKLDVEKQIDEIKKNLEDTKIVLNKSDDSLSIKMEKVSEVLGDKIAINTKNIDNTSAATKNFGDKIQESLKRIQIAEAKIKPDSIINSVNESLANGKIIGGASTILDKNKFVVKDIDNSRVELEKGHITAYNTENKKTYYMNDSEIGICAKDNSDPLGVLTSVYKKTLNDGASQITPGGTMKGVGLFAGDYAGYLTFGHDDIWGDDSKYDEYLTFNKKGYAHFCTGVGFGNNPLQDVKSINTGLGPTLINGTHFNSNAINTNSTSGNLWLNYAKGPDTYNAHQDDINVRIGRGWNNGQHGSLVCQDLWVHGNKHNIVNTKELGFVGVHAYEMAEPQFGDNGGGRINEEGFCYIPIEPVFQKTINCDVEYRVQITIISEDITAKVQCSEKKSDYFKAIGTPGVTFDWEVKCKRKGYENNRLDRIRETLFMESGTNNNNLKTNGATSVSNKNSIEENLLDIVSIGHINKNQNINNLQSMIKDTNKNNILI